MILGMAGLGIQFFPVNFRFISSQSTENSDVGASHQNIVYVALVVMDYDEAISSTTQRLHFTLIVDSKIATWI